MLLPCDYGDHSHELSHPLVRVAPCPSPLAAQYSKKAHARREICYHGTMKRSSTELGFTLLELVVVIMAVILLGLVVFFMTYSH